MAEPKRKLFRTEAIDRLSTPEDLEALMPVAGPNEWLLILVTAAVLLLFVFWAFVGQIPTTVSGRGLILRPSQIMQAQTTVAGRILSLRVRAGVRVQVGDIIASIDQSDIVKRVEENRRNLSRLVEQDVRQSAAEQHQTALQAQQDSMERASLDAQRALLQKSLDDATGLRPILDQHARANRRLVEEKLLGFGAKDLVESEAAVLDNDAKIRAYSSQLSQFGGQLQQIETRSAALARQVLNDSVARRDGIAQTRHAIEIDEFQIQRDGTIRSQYSGRVAEVMAAVGQVLPAGARLLTLEADGADAGLLSISYLPVRDGKKIQPGMELQVIPDTVERERYGGIVGTVSSVSPAPITKEGAISTIGNADVVQSLIPEGAFIEIRARLTADPSTYSGYRWSSSAGPDMKVTAGLTHSVRIKVEGRAPVTYLFPILREVTGVY